MTCLMLARRFLCEIMTPAGWRVDPEVYCKYATLGRSVPAPLPLLEFVSSESISRMAAADSPDCGFAHSLTSPTTADVVRMTDGDASRSTELTRSSAMPPVGTDRGTAMSPACSAPRKAAM